MSSLFDHNRDSTVSSFNKVYKIKNKNKEGHKKILLNVRSLKSPDARSNSIRKKSASKLFKQAHHIPSETTQETVYGEKSENEFFGVKTAENQRIKSSNKIKRMNTMEEGKNKITLKKKLSQGSNIQRTVDVCINGQTVLNSKQDDVIDSLTRLILDDGRQSKQGANADLDNLFAQNTITQNSFELQIDSNLVEGNPELFEWSELIKRL